jgi:hypothetical protein
MAGEWNGESARLSADGLRGLQNEEGGWSREAGQEGEAFETAFSILALSLRPEKESRTSAERGIRWLLRNQLPDGSWKTAPILRIPEPMVSDPETVERWRTNQEGSGVIIEDQERIFSSAAAHWALAAYHRMMRNG